MGIEHTSISYYGLNYVEHAEKDFDEMIGHGCDTVILAITEFDMDFWFPNISEIIKAGHKKGLRMIADLWGIGKYFGGEQVSLFLQNNIHHRQVSAHTGEAYPAACFNSNAFRDYFNGLCLKLARETEIDGFFWDEPKYFMPVNSGNVAALGGDDWTCRCPECMEKFKTYYGYEMPRLLNLRTTDSDITQFRWREALKTLSDASALVKSVNPKLEITCCVHATLNTYYSTERRGYDNWDMVAACPHFDVFSTTIIGWDQPEKFFLDVARRTVTAAKKYGKQSERWLLGYYKQPDDFAQIDRIVDLYVKEGVDRLGTWTYRGGYGTNLAAPDALKLWDAIGKNYKRVLNKK